MMNSATTTGQINQLYENYTNEWLQDELADHIPLLYLQVSLIVEVLPHPALVVNLLLGSLSQVTAPAEFLRMYLYSNTVLAGRSIVALQSGLLAVYLAALSALAASGLQLPSWVSWPVTKTFSP